MQIRAIHRVLSLWLIAIIVLPYMLVFADEAASASFRTKNAEFGSFGGTSTSTNFYNVQSGDTIPDGTSSSTNFVVDAGPLYFESFSPRSQNWRWYEDPINETPADDLALENVAPSDIQTAQIVKLRVSVAEIANIGAVDVKFRLQFSTSSDFSSGVGYISNSVQCTSSSTWCYADGGGADNGIITTGTLSDADSCVASVGTGCGTHNETATSSSTFVHAASAVTEYEFTIQESGARANTVYFFRLLDVNASSTVPTNTGESYPSLSTGGGTLTFTIGGVASSTATEGVTTDVDTTPTTVAFGSLPFNTEVDAAQRLTVTTDASQGYKVFVFERQSLTNELSSTIDPVSASNASPASWASSCLIAAESCYGYHAGEDVLDGGSTRFAADDTYARFEGEPQEVAFTTGPATSRETDIIYRIEARAGEQSGNYESAIAYIVVPTF